MVSKLCKLGDRGMFSVYKRDKEKYIEVYIGDPEDIESEFILCVHEDLVKELIASLRLSEDFK
jgi:hypothetical protein